MTPPASLPSDGFSHWSFSHGEGGRESGGGREWDGGREWEGFSHWDGFSHWVGERNGVDVRDGAGEPQGHGVRHWVIGDVHGCADSLNALVAKLPEADQLIFCGDLINRGPRILETMERAWALVESGRAVWLRGNHEQALLENLRGEGWLAWRNLAGCDTYRQLGDRCCRAWQERLAALPTAYWGDGWVATHAGFDPIGWQPHLSIRHAFWNAYDGRFGDVVVGHTPGEQVRRVGRDLRIVLIDTAACYGGRLTAYCPETGMSHHVDGPRPATGSALPPQRLTAIS